MDHLSLASAIDCFDNLHGEATHLLNCRIIHDCLFADLGPLFRVDFQSIATDMEYMNFRPAWIEISQALVFHY